ncbi:MAG: glycosyltransferase, partial [archaeon]
NTGGVKEVVNDGITGILVNPNNLIEIKKAIIKLLEDKKLQKTMGINGYYRTQKMFSKEKLNKLFKSLLEEI